MIVIIAFSVFLLCLVSLNRKNVAYSKETVNTYVQKIEKCTNEKDRKKLEQVVQNETAVNQLLEDFSDDDMIIKEMNYMAVPQYYDSMNIYEHSPELLTVKRKTNHN